ncbi:MAG: 30S ribosomal protein S6 [bacterium]
MRRYELLVILNAEISEEDLEKVVDRITQVIKKEGGEVSGVDKWGKRRLAYEIKKTKKGFYLLVQFAGEARLLKEIERNLRFMEGIIRYMTVALSEKVDPSLSRSYSAENREEAVL